MSVPPIPDTRVLAVASHVVSGNVGNKIAVFVLQSLGCDVAALNTVQFSNHTGYRQWKGTKVSAQEILDLYEGLKQSYLDDFDMMLTGYIPGAPAVEAVGLIAKELQAKTESAAGSFFWVLDPVMGDEGKLYVAEDVVPAYKNLVSYADLILPNQFEAELLSEVKITDVPSLKAAIQTLHERYKIPHVVITSVKLDSTVHSPPTHASVVGSTMTSDGKSRPFKIVFPSLDCYFSGTGDMFAALMVVRMREAVEHVPGLRTTRSWRSDDAVPPLELPLARAAEKVLASMHEVLTRTIEGMQESIDRSNRAIESAKNLEAQPNKDHLLRSKAAELRLARNLRSLTSPEVTFPACLF